MTEQVLAKVVTETFPPEHSMRGDNAFYLKFCHAVNHKPGYAICANKVFAYERDGKLFNPECARYMARGDCEAMQCVKLEREAGKALFYVKRGPIEVIPDHPRAPEVRKTSKPMPIMHTPHPDDLKPRRSAHKPASNGYADAINVAMSELDNSVVNDSVINDVVSPKYEACGGCGAESPAERCINCFHDFGGTDGAMPAPPQESAQHNQAGKLSLLEIARQRMQRKA